MACLYIYRLAATIKEFIATLLIYYYIALLSKLIQAILLIINHRICEYR